MSMTDRAILKRALGGFTLVESIIVILLVGILAAVAAVFVVQPFEAARDMTRRAELVDAAETALNRMTREIRLAVPNSVRINAGNDALEFLRTSTGGRYRRLNDDDPATADDVLEPAASSDSFDVLGGLPGDVAVGAAGRACADMDTGTEDCMVINNTGTTGFDAYNADNVAAITDAAPGSSNPDTLTFDIGGGSTPPAFPAHSSNQRFQVFDTVVTYACTGNRINRHHDYGLNPTQVAPPTDGVVSLLARDVIACNFTYTAGAGRRHGLVTIDLTIRRDGETVRLVDQVHVVNVP